MKRILFLLCVILKPALVSAQSQFDSITYTLPPGWNVTVTNEQFVILQPEPVRLQTIEDLLLVLMRPAPITQAASSALEVAYNEVLASLTVEPEFDEGRVYRASPPIQTSDGRTLLLGLGRCHDAAGTYDLRVYLLQDKDVYLRVFTFANVLPASIAYPPTSAMYNPRFAYEIPGFVLQLSTGASLQHPPQPTQSLSGLWRGLSMSGGDFKNAYAYFYPDGRAFFASRMPMNGFDSLPTDADAVVTPTYWGRYGYDGLQGEIQFPYRGNEAFPFTAAANKLTIVTTGTPHEFWPQSSVDGLMFEGTYFLQLVSGEKPTLSLSANGRFVDQGLLKYVDHWIYPFRVSDAPGDGSYAVTNFTIIFRYSDGRILRLPFSGLGLTADTSPATLAIGTEDDLLTLSGGPPPRLTIALDAADPRHLQIRWPAAATGYVLQARDSLASPPWGAISEPTTVEGTENVVTILFNGYSRFFRLVK